LPPPEPKVTVSILAVRANFIANWASRKVAGVFVYSGVDLGLTLAEIGG
jgi:hypothetical protein